MSPVRAMQLNVECKRGPFTLRGIAHIPKSGCNIPAVILLHGFTGTKSEFSFTFVELSRELENLGISCFRFDFAGSGDSDGRFMDMSIATETEDANAMLDFVKSLGFVDASRIGLLGMSMGGAVASMVAGTRRDDLKALCLWAPAGSMPDSMRKGRYAPYPIDKTTRRRGYVDVNGLRLGMKFFDDLETVNIYGEAKKYDKDVLIIHGDKDATVPFDYSTRYLNIYGDKAKLVKIAGAGHLFDRIEHREELIRSTADFLASELTG